MPDFKSLLSPLKTKRSLPFLYGFMFAFVVFTVFLAFNPSPNSSSPWFFSNIFAATLLQSTAATVVAANGENNPSFSLKSNQTSIDAPQPAIAANLTVFTPTLSNATSDGAVKTQQKQSNGSGGRDGSKQRNETVKQGG
ncbi:hypothetical protein LINPERHAP2_LOCUS20048 [Linum perenne]